jgi:mRNA interferase RelE/StbE
MARLDGLASVLDFLNGLQPKIAAQIANKEYCL